MAAYYGPTQVTELVQSKVEDNNLAVEASNSVFGNTWEDVKKSLVVFYQYGDSKVYLRVAGEDESMEIFRDDEHQGGHFDPQAYTGMTRVLAAVYGPEDVTKLLAGMLADKGELEVHADNSVFGDTWLEAQKTLVVLYQACDGEIKSEAVKESATMRLE